MKTPATQTFLVGRATADLLRERLESFVTDVFSQTGKFVVEFQEQWTTFGEEVSRRAAVMQTLDVTPISDPNSDLQAVLDDLRAEVAQLRSELQKYRSQSL